MMKKSTFCLLLIFTGCATYESNRDNSSATIESRDINDSNTLAHTSADTATPLSEQQYNQQRAHYFGSLSTSSVHQKVDTTLSSAEYSIQAQDYSQAKTSIAQLDHTRLSQQQANRLTVIQAYIDYAQRDYRVALSRLNRLLENNAIPENTTLAKQQRIDALLLRSFNYQSLGDHSEAILSLIKREQYLTGTARAENSRYTWQLIRNLSDAARSQILAETQDPMLRNRLQQNDYEHYTPIASQPPQFKQWRNDSLNQQTQDISNQWHSLSPKKIAVLLPLSSKFNKAAQAVYDGIQYQHSLNQSANQPQIELYDIGNDPLQVARSYYAAQTNGSELIIGPLGMSFANQLSQVLGQASSRTYISPTILLGGNAALPNRRLVRLTLSPEQEGIQIAQKAFANGHINAALLVANSSQSQRTANAFQQYWLEHGGKISNLVTYSEHQYDHSAQLKQLFNIHDSEYRLTKLTSILGFKPKFSAYRRQDIDVIFMLANNQTGRIIRPQINFFQDKNIPVLSTSNIYNGVQDDINNVDLDSTHFPSLPWVFESSDISQYAGQLNKLFALGIDSYNIAANFSRLRNNAALSINGKMGRLNIEPSGNIKQQPIWANFQQGVAVTSAPYVPLKETLLQQQGNQLIPSSSLQQGKNRYDDSNWDARQSRRKTGTHLPKQTRP